VSEDKLDFRMTISFTRPRYLYTLKDLGRLIHRGVTMKGRRLDKGRDCSAIPSPSVGSRGVEAPAIALALGGMKRIAEECHMRRWQGVREGDRPLEGK